LIIAIVYDGIKIVDSILFYALIDKKYYYIKEIENKQDKKLVTD
jgi:hypothetical protein